MEIQGIAMRLLFRKPAFRQKSYTILCRVVAHRSFDNFACRKFGEKSILFIDLTKREITGSGRKSYGTQRDRDEDVT